MLKVDDIVRGSLWPEVVEIKKCEVIQERFYRVEALERIQVNRLFTKSCT